MTTKQSNKAKAIAFFGKEPVVNDAQNKLQIITALNWLRQEQTPELSRRWLKDFMKKNYTKQQINDVLSNIRYMPSSWFSVARLLTNGSVLPDSVTEQLKQEIARIIDITDDTQPGRPVLVKQVTIPTEALEYIDALLEKSKTSKVNEEELARVTKMNLSKAQIDIIIKDYANELKDLTLVDSGDPEASESYSGYTKKQVRSMLGLLTNLFEQLQQVKKVIPVRAKSIKKPRKVNKEKMVSRLRFMKESAEYRVASVDPQKLLGAKTAVVFNSKNRAVAIYYAKNEEGFKVSGSSLKNFDDTKSSTKRFRKPNDIIHLGIKAGIEKTFAACKTIARPANGRFNEHTIILKVWN